MFPQDQKKRPLNWTAATKLKLRSTADCILLTLEMDIPFMVLITPLHSCGFTTISRGDYEPNQTLCRGLAALLVFYQAAKAFDMGGLAIHGSVSGTAAESNKYNFYGNTDGKFDVIQKEITLN